MAAPRFTQQVNALERDPGAPGRYGTTFSEIWNCPVVPHGGLVTATALRAIERELDLPDQPLRSVSTVFAGQVLPGPATIDVTILRRGRSISQATATVRTEGEAAGHTLVAVFGAPRHGFEFVDVAPPADVPAPETCPSFRERRLDDAEVMHMPFWDHLEGRPALGHAPWDDYQPDTSSRAAWYRFDESPMLDDGKLDPLALVTMCDTMPGAVTERMGPAARRVPWLPPSCDLTVHVLGETTSEWVLVHNRARWAGEGYASTEITLWDPDGALLAYGTQIMFFVFPEGPPPADARRPTGT